MAKRRQPNAEQSQPPPASNDQAVIVRATLNRVVETVPNMPSIYANDAQIQLSPWDIRLIFGQISNIPTPDKPEVVVKVTGEVRLSLPLAKKIAMILVSQIKHYEATVGQIPLPPD